METPKVWGPDHGSPPGPLGLYGSRAPCPAQAIRLDTDVCQRLVPKTYSPDDPTLHDCWRQRRSRPRALAGRPWQLASRQQGLCPVGHQLLENGEDLDVHHVLPKKQGGTDGLANLRLVHANGHGRFTAPGRLLGYVDGLSRVLGDGYARF